MTEIWAMTVNERVEDIERQAARAEAAGLDGLCYSDSQNIRMECWVALTVAARVTSRLKLGTCVTNPVTRHPAVTASAAATLQEVSGGRFTLGVGRGDSALAYLGYGPVPMRDFEHYLVRVQAYLRGEEVPFETNDFADVPRVDSLGYARVPKASKIRWLPASQPKVPVEIAGSGPKVVALAARLADGITFGMGADLERLAAMQALVRNVRAEAGLAAQPFTTTAILNVIANPDRDAARKQVAGVLSSTLRWSVMQSRRATEGMDEATRAEFDAARAAYDMTRHMEAGTSHAASISDALIDRLGIAGPSDYCVERIREVRALGFDRLLLPIPLASDAPSTQRLLEEVLPQLR